MGTVTVEDVSVPAPTPGPLDWNGDGVVILEDVIPTDLLDTYCEAWKRDNAYRPKGYPSDTPYTEIPELADICSFARLHKEMGALIGEPAGLHLNLSGWVTTERDWHQDTYLNPPHVGDHYVAVWMALDDIHPDSGPFQYVPGSHMWFQVTREKMLEAMPHTSIADPSWPRKSEQILTPLFEHEIKNREAEIVTYLPKKGDVLLWHSRLLHRGSKAKIPGMERRSLIAHYSGIYHRSDMRKAERYSEGFIFPF